MLFRTSWDIRYISHGTWVKGSAQVSIIISYISVYVTVLNLYFSICEHLQMQLVEISIHFFPSKLWVTYSNSLHHTICISPAPERPISTEQSPFHPQLSQLLQPPNKTIPPYYHRLRFTTTLHHKAKRNLIFLSTLRAAITRRVFTSTARNQTRAPDRPAGLLHLAR